MIASGPGVNVESEGCKNRHLLEGFVLALQIEL